MTINNNIGPIKPNTGKDETTRFGQVRPEGAPQSDKPFKPLIKPVKNNNPKDDEEEEDLTIEDKSNNNAPPSLFDLASANRLKKPLGQSGLIKQPILTDENAPLLKEDIADMGENYATKFGGNYPVNKINSENVKPNELMKDLSQPFFKTNLEPNKLAQETVITTGKQPELNQPNQTVKQNKEVKRPSQPVLMDKEEIVQNDRDEEIPATVQPKKISPPISEKEGFASDQGDEKNISIQVKSFSQPSFKEGITQENDTTKIIQTGKLFQPLTDEGTVKEEITTMEGTEKPFQPKNILTENEINRNYAAIQAKKARPGDLQLDTDATVLAPKKEKIKISVNARAEFSEENPDLSVINPNAQQTVAFNSNKIDLKEEHVARSNLSDIVNQIVDRIHTVSVEGKTDTVVTLRYPPIFSGATVTLSTQEGAKREFNIAFANLTEAAKVFLDQRLADKSLTDALERRGILVLGLTTTTLVSAPLNVEAEQYFGKDAQEQQMQQQRQQRQQQQQNPEEENT